MGLLYVPEHVNGPENQATFSTNPIQNENQLQYGHLHFPILKAVCLFLFVALSFRVVITKSNRLMIWNEKVAEMNNAWVASRCVVKQHAKWPHGWCVSITFWLSMTSLLIGTLWYSSILSLTVLIALVSALQCSIEISSIATEFVSYPHL